MGKPTILITGCSSGIGYDAAHGLARSGWRVFATCRKETDAERLRSEGLESWRLDYEDEDSIAAGLDEALSRTGGTLDALFNNGAYAIPGLVEDMPTGALRAIFETNVFGQHELARRVLPVMRAQGHGRILFNSSILGFTALPWRGAYNSTKYALEGYCDTLRREMRGTGIHVILIQPGPITALIRQNSIPHFEKWFVPAASARADEYETKLKPRLYKLGNERDPFELPASAVTRAVKRALTAKNPRARYRITLPTKIAAIGKRLLPTRLQDRILARL
ncbi:SDR family NAD(P)-dependent oxidoreductase [Alphaproteobacteria bacterium GH1-50]|uniref:SDR family NAD(P)-dependent oxidoreductase n=1 Tax=Kangsaoukella pontilimi TaxID=2691042 RepID=A0A7C9MR70_9RHOB|nr:SDR family NAD(P)-dependent oxidoreductase [Kangsaoukella pontilimi]MXQ08057.1 SDR family NAD(P)-dependent oxidoreductase [Kangsaoukella pontilimi]